MWNLLWPMLMVVGANTVYNICAKSVPDKLNSFAALTINYLVAAGLSLALAGCSLPMTGFADYDVSGYFQALLDSADLHKEGEI